MTMRLRAGVLLVLLFTLIWLVVLAPARLLGAFVGSRPLQFGAFSGSLWQGQSDYLLIQSQNLRFDAGQLSWRVDAAALLTGRLCVQVQAVRSSAGSADLQRIEGNICADSRRQLYLRDVSIRVPAQRLLHAEALRLQGVVDIQIHQARLLPDGHWLDANAQGLWSDAALLVNMGSRWAPLTVGHLPLDVRALADGSLQVRMDNSDVRRAADTGLMLDATVQNSQLISLEAQVRPGTEVADELLAWLSVIAEPDDSGVYRFSWRRVSNLQ